MQKAFKHIPWLSVVAALVALPLLVWAGPPQGLELPTPPAKRIPPFVKGQILLSVESGASTHGVAHAVGAKVLRSIGDGSIQLLGVKDGSVPSAVTALRGMRGVVFAEPNWLRTPHDVPDDAGYPLKWDLNNESLCGSSECSTPGTDMDWQEAYTLLGSGFDGSAVVAVIDTGIDFNHPDLDEKIWVNHGETANGIDSDDNGFVDDVNGYDFRSGDADPTDTYGHGTHVAGIALAETNNAIGTVGVGYSPNIQVMPLRVCDENGCPTSAIADAIYYAADNGADVINLSLGGTHASKAERRAVDYAWRKGLVLAASSGNNGARRVSYPAAFADVIAVGGTNWYDELAYYSNTGKALDVVAPGGEMTYLGDPAGIYSTMPTYAVYLTQQGYFMDYDQLQGTSMAAPQVSGLAALLFAAGVTDSNGDGKLNGEIRDIIETTATDLGPTGRDNSFGWGRINVYAALQEALGGAGDSPPNVTITDPNDDDSVSGTVIVTADASDDDAVMHVEFFVDGVSIDVDSDGTDGWSASWDTTTETEGYHAVTATATDTAAQTASHSIAVTVDNEPAAAVSVTGITPASMAAGKTEPVTIHGSGFDLNWVEVTFENGDGASPQAFSIVVSSSSTIFAIVTVKKGGKRRNRVWDVRVTNSDGSSAVLLGGFTVTP